MNSKKLKILHLGAGNAAAMDAAVLEYFAQHDVVHFGEDPEICKPHFLKRVLDALRQYGIGYLISQTILRLRLRSKTTKKFSSLTDELISQDFRRWHYQRGDRLPFIDSTFDAVYSEHFFEHIFIDEAQALFKEIYRVLAPGGVVRTSVPDADLRTYQNPEPVGFPARRMAFSHPSKHKTRWSVYSISLVLENADFAVCPVVYCDREGTFHDLLRDNSLFEVGVSQRVQEGFLSSPDYVLRERSLIVDGIKRC